MNHKPISDIIYEFLDEKQAEEIQLFNVQGHSAEADLFVIATARNQRHLQALANDVQERIEREGYKLHHREGMPESGWILLDFNDLILHLFDSEMRRFYSLERLWSSFPTLHRP